MSLTTNPLLIKRSDITVLLNFQLNEGLDEALVPLFRSVDLHGYHAEGVIDLCSSLLVPPFSVSGWTNNPK